VQAALAWTQAWVEIAEVADCRVVNRASAMASNSSKPFQSQCLAAAGFAIPPMLMSNDPQAVLRFEDEHGPLIYKSASGVRSVVSPLDAAARRRLAAVRHTPTLFQKCLRGTNVRVHVVGHELFATEIDSDAIDYRYAGRQGGSTELRATRLSPDTEAACRRASDALGLPFCGLDLMLADDGQTYCFEANPSPGYSYYESATGQPIAAALARHLAGRD
jgi:glutathione synthase/RimK-type ligase-like ATP-grasp enzyme